MRIVCSWCGTTTTEAGQDDDGLVSHGMCPTCFDEKMQAQDRTRYIEPTDEELMMVGLLPPNEPEYVSDDEESYPW